MDESGLFSKHTAKELGISTALLRMWCIKLENEGYIFDRNEQGQRIFYQKDIILLKKFKKIIGKQKNYKIAVESVLSEEEVAPTLRQNDNITLSDLLSEYQIIKSDNEQMIEDNRHMKNELKRLEGMDEKLDRMEQMIEKMKELQIEQIIEDNRGFFQRLFNRK